MMIVYVVSSACDSYLLVLLIYNYVLFVCTDIQYNSVVINFTFLFYFSSKYDNLKEFDELITSQLSFMNL